MLFALLRNYGVVDDCDDLRNLLIQYTLILIFYVLLMHFNNKNKNLWGYLGIIDIFFAWASFNDREGRFENEIDGEIVIEFWDVNGDDINDDQNVHDHLVTNNIVNAITLLQQKYKITVKSIMPIEKEIGQNRDVSGEKRRKALKTLQTIRDVNSTYGYGSKNITESEILLLVWARINDDANKDVRKDMIVLLIEQLADANESCIVGRITRIIQTLEIIDKENIINIQPTWAAKEEIDNYFGHYVNKLMDKVDDPYSEAVGSIDRTPDQEKKAKKFYKCVERNLKKKFKMLYLDTHILTKKELDRITKKNYEGLA